MSLKVKPNFEWHIGRSLPLYMSSLRYENRCSVDSTEPHSQALLAQGALSDLAWGLLSLGEQSCQPSLSCGAGQTGKDIS